ncbi:MAG: fibrobacter succinogenes major paralogous domain-containing protein [Cyclobacteriaceae bacterium]
MKTRIRLSAAVLVMFVLFSNAVNHAVADYKSVKIGDQVWMVENLNVDRFRNGEAITHATTSEEWVRAGKEGKPAWCYYENKQENGQRYGKLYNWYAVTDPRGVAPEGYRVATDADWRLVTDFLGGEDAAGTKMKSPGGWVAKGNGTNESGFSGLPGGSRNLYGEFQYGEQGAYWWTSTERDRELAWYRVIDQSPYYVYRTNYSKANGLSVRCVRV